MKSHVDLPPGATVVLPDGTEFAALTLTREQDYESVRYGAHEVPDPSWASTCPGCSLQVHHWTRADENSTWYVANAERVVGPSYYCDDCRDEHDGEVTWKCVCGYRVIPVYKIEPGGVKQYLRSDETGVALAMLTDPPAEIKGAVLRHEADGHTYDIPLPGVLVAYGDVSFAHGEPLTVNYLGRTPVA